jgi:protein-tyrosine-phosphatase/predicted ATP-grasp superfamily ATP-dependent carboligase
MTKQMIKGSQYRPVLILGASPRISVSIARSLHRHGIPVDIASFQPEEPDIHSRAVRQFHRLPTRQENPDGFTAAFLALVLDKQFDLILPAGDPALKALADLYDQLGALHVGCPPPRSVQRVLNKSLTLETAQRCGIRVPFTCSIATIAELDAIEAQLRFPVVVKPEKKGAAAFRVFYFNTLPDLRSALKNRDWGSILLQEYCPGVGVGVELLIHKGECVATFQHRRLNEAPATGGVAVLAISEDPDPELMRSSKTLLRALDWEGVAMVEFRVERETGISTLMEVNGRFWGSVSLPIMAGVDFPLYYWQLFHGEQPLVPNRYKVGMHWRWSPGCLERIQSIIFRNAEGVGSRPSRWQELVRAPADFSPFTREALWSWSDPFPFFAEMGAALSVLLTGFLKALSRRFLPQRVKPYAGIYSRLAPEARPVYVKLCIHNVLGLGSADGRGASGRVPQDAKSFLFVCFGNLMRSPMAAAMLRHALAEQAVDGIVVRSAGLHAVPGRKAHLWALAVSRELGIPLDQHQAQLLTPELVSSSDAIFAMDFENLAELETLYPNAKNKILLLSSYADGKQRHSEIPDPYFGDIETTRRCYSVLSKCIGNLARDIGSSPSPKGSLPSR